MLRQERIRPSGHLRGGRDSGILVLAASSKKPAEDSTYGSSSASRLKSEDRDPSHRCILGLQHDRENPKGGDSYGDS